MKRARSGFTLIEFLIAIVILSIISVGMFTAFPIIAQMQQEAKNQAIATNLAQEFIDDIRSMAEEENASTHLPYFDTLEEIYTANPNDRKPIPNDPDGLYSNFTYNQRVDVQDSSGLLGFDLKRVTVNVYWNRNGKEQKLTLATLLSHPAVSLPGNIEGQVYVAGSNPRIYLKNAEVRLYRSHSYYGRRWSNFEGYYSFLEVPAASYQIKATKNNFYGNMISCAVPAGGTITIDIPLEPFPNPGKITGVVTDADTNDPIRSIRIRAYGNSLKYYNQNRYSNVNGQYTFNSCPVQDYQISVLNNKDKGYMDWEPVTIQVVSGEPTTCNIVLKPIYTGGIRGIVSDSVKHTPIPNIWIRMTNKEDGSYKTALSGSDGIYYNNELSVGDYTVALSNKADAFRQGYKNSFSPVTVTVKKAEITNQDILLEPIPTGGMKGTVTDADTNLPIPGANVNIMWRHMYSTINAIKCDGVYSMATNIIPMPQFVNEPNHRATASASGYYSLAQYPALIEGQLTTLNFKLTKKPPKEPPQPKYYGGVEGTVTDKDTGKPINSVSVYIGGKGSKTNISGYYYIQNIVVGISDVRASKTGYYYYDSDNEGKRVTVIQDDIVTFNFSMKEVGYGTITGTVTARDTEKPIQGAYVYLRTYGGAPRYSYRAYTDANGKYTMPKVCETLTGKLHNYIYAQKHPDYIRLYKYDDFSLSKGETKVFDFVLSPAREGM